MRLGEHQRSLAIALFRLTDARAVVFLGVGVEAFEEARQAFEQRIGTQGKGDFLVAELSRPGIAHLGHHVERLRKVQGPRIFQPAQGLGVVFSFEELAPRLAQFLGVLAGIIFAQVVVAGTGAADRDADAGLLFRAEEDFVDFAAGILPVIHARGADQLVGLRIGDHGPAALIHQGQLPGRHAPRQGSIHEGRAPANTRCNGRNRPVRAGRARRRRSDRCENRARRAGTPATRSMATNRADWSLQSP